MIKPFLFLVFCVLNFFLAHAVEKTSTNSYPVGELGEAWQFPSDHLPVGGTVGNVQFVMWNILHTGALHHIVDNGQGLRDSYIMQANVPYDDLITVRDAAIIADIMEMIQKGKSLLALQETSEEVFTRLQETLPKNMKLYPEKVEDVGHGDVFIYDTDLFDVLSINKAHYEVRPHNTMMTLTLQEKATGLIYQFMQSHVPGGPVLSAPAREELAKNVKENYNPEAIAILVGDMNRSPDYFIKNFDQVFENQPFRSLEVPYPTHINTTREASWIDNIFIANPHEGLKVEVSLEFFESLQPTIDLLESFRLDIH